MSDLIERDKLIKALEMMGEEKLHPQAVIWTIKKIVPVEPMKWIPCSERLPAYGESVLVTLWGEDLDVGVFDFDDRTCGLMFSANDFDIKGEKDVLEEVDAWMPLPEPYKEGGAE